jgi:CBS domain-containing protein
MGEHQIRESSDSGELQLFMRQLIREVRAFEKMLADELFETDPRRIGAEQELFLVDASHRPAPVAMELLEEIDDPRFTTELARFNLELNLDPVVLGDSCLSAMERQLRELLDKAHRAAAKLGVQVLLTGILPTLEKADLSMDNMAPVPRYHVLADAFQRLRGSAFSFHIKGRDELTVHHESVMGEACNTSFQFHFQVTPANFAKYYNAAQLVSGPVLAAATNSPLLFGRRLWHETRIALFRQSVDTRPSDPSHHRNLQPRVSFGRTWVDQSVIEIFQEDVARFRLLMSSDAYEDPFAVLAAGGIPELKALRLHLGTVYRWNRACYGVSATGRPHLRIENRILPSGPTVVDEIANGAFWIGLVKGVGDEYGDARRHISFDEVRDNFLTAARRGLAAELHWIGRGSVPASQLLLEELLPMARRGLDSLGIGAADRDRYLDVVRDRVESRRTGSMWLLDSLEAMGDAGSHMEKLASLTASTLAHQREEGPGHTWPLARLREGGGWQEHYRRVASLMTTDLFTVNEDEVIDLVASLMDWKHIRHVPVEDNAHRLVGLVTHRTLLRVLAREYGSSHRPIPVKEVMHTDVVTVSPSTPTLEAMRVMKERRVACLPVVENGRLVGILSERDFMKIFGQLLEDFLGGAARETAVLPPGPPGGAAA